MSTFHQRGCPVTPIVDGFRVLGFLHICFDKVASNLWMCGKGTFVISAVLRVAMFNGYIAPFNPRTCQIFFCLQLRARFIVLSLRRMILC